MHGCRNIAPQWADESFSNTLSVLAENHSKIYTQIQVKIRRYIMKTMNMIFFAASIISAVLLSGCESSQGHEGAIIGGAAGAAGGALIGSAAAGSGNRGTGALIGGAIGGVAGGVAGDQLHDKKQND
jgi:hypothetical protein